MEKLSEEVRGSEKAAGNDGYLFYSGEGSLTFLEEQNICLLFHPSFMRLLCELKWHSVERIPFL